MDLIITLFGVAILGTAVYKLVTQNRNTTSSSNQYSGGDVVISDNSSKNTGTTVPGKFEGRQPKN